MEDQAGPAGDEFVFGVHPVTEALEQRGRTVDRLWVARERESRVGRLLRLARSQGVPVSRVPGKVLSRRLGSNARHQGLVAAVAAVPYASSQELYDAARSDPAGLLVALDGVQDPRNLGAILRTCAAAGAVGVVLGGSGRVGLTATVAKAAAGALERLAVGREARLPAFLRRAQSDGFTVLALEPRGQEPWDALDLRGRVIVVGGSEGRGLRPGVRAACNQSVAVPLAAGVESLNVGVALAVLLFEAVRQRRVSGAAGAPET